MEMESNEIKKIEAEYQKVMQNKRQMVEKRNENDMVMTEFNLLKDEESATIFKLVGPIMAKQSF